jgi:hypothetical protein
MLVVYCTTGSLCGGCIYKCFDVMAVHVWCLLSYCVLILCSCWSNYMQ